MKLKLAIAAAIVASALYAYIEMRAITDSPLADENTQVGQVAGTVHESSNEIPLPTQDLHPVVQASIYDESPIVVTSSATMAADHFQLSHEAKERIEVVLYELVSGVEMPTYGYVNDFSCEPNECSIGIHLTTTSNLMRNAAKIMTTLNAALLSADATNDVQIGISSIKPNEGGEGIIRLVTMERRPIKHNISVDEKTGAVAVTFNENAKDDSASP